MILRVFEFVVVVSIIMFIVTQMLVPAFFGGKMFPSFRKTGKLEAELAEVTQEVKDAKLETVIAEVRKEVVEEEKSRLDKI